MPIYFAAKRGYTAAVEALLQHGALLLPPRRSDNALIFAAAQPSACTLILHASRSLEQAQRRRLYSTLVPPNLPLPEAITQPPGKPTWKAVLDACDDRKVPYGCGSAYVYHQHIRRACSCLHLVKPVLHVCLLLDCSCAAHPLHTHCSSLRPVPCAVRQAAARLPARGGDGGGNGAAASAAPGAAQHGAAIPRPGAHGPVGRRTRQQQRGCGQQQQPCWRRQHRYAQHGW